LPDAALDRGLELIVGKTATCHQKGAQRAGERIALAGIRLQFGMVFGPRTRQARGSSNTLGSSRS
jgi:hypothetical protein